jgi:hypothetical protein
MHDYNYLQLVIKVRIALVNDRNIAKITTSENEGKQA